MLRPTVSPTAAWIAAHRDCEHFDGSCRHNNVDFVPVEPEPELPEPCFKPVVLDTAGETVSVCHRLAGHAGECSDWAPDECIVADCACTEDGPHHDCSSIGGSHSADCQLALSRNSWTFLPGDENR